MSVRTVHTSFTSTDRPLHTTFTSTDRPLYTPPGLPAAMSSTHSLNVLGSGVGVGLKAQRRRTGHQRRADFKFDPFASDDAPSQAWQHTPSQFTIQLPNISTRSLPNTVKTHPISPPKPDKNARARIVAGILLNRIYAVGKPMRRRMTSSKTYVRSSLSSVVTVEC